MVTNRGKVQKEQIAADKMSTYLETARRRQAAERQRLAQRRRRAWEVARRAADLLRQRFGSGRVLVFGSLVHSTLFHARSDVDLAVWGLAEGEYYRAVSQLLDLDPTFEIDLIRAEEAPPSLLARIRQEGVEI